MLVQPTVIAGVGPGLGASLARRFARGGYPVALLARSEDYLNELASKLEDQGHQALPLACDLSREAEVQAAFDKIRDRWGRTGILLYNAGNFVRGGIRDISASTFRSAWETGCLGAFLCSRQVIPAMVKAAEGTIIFTGATSSVYAPPHGPAFGSAKFALRGLAQALAREIGSEGVHVAHVLIDGVLATPRTRSYLNDMDEDEFIQTDDLAETYWQLAQQPPSAWSFEVDARPYTDPLFEN